MARYKAVQAVKRQMIAEGLKPTHIEMRIITAQANAYLAEHQGELLAEAAETIARWPGLRKLAEAEARRTVHKCQVMHSRRRPDR
jgi:hypothetical protein